MQEYFKKELFLDFSIILGSVLLAAVAIFFLNKDVASQAEKVSSARLSVAKQTAALGILATLKKDAPVAANYRQAMRRILITEDQLLNFPRVLESLARGRNLSLSFSPQGNPSGAGENTPGQLPFSLRLGGGLDNIIGFISDAELQSQNFLVSLDSFNLKGNGSYYDFTGGARVFLGKK